MTLVWTKTTHGQGFTIETAKRSDGHFDCDYHEDGEPGKKYRLFFIPRNDYDRADHLGDFRTKAALKAAANKYIG